MAENTLTNPKNWVSVDKLDYYHKKNTEERDALLTDKQGVFQFSEIPTAAEGNLGAIIQYTGATNDDFTNGYFYKCVENSGVYSWENIPVQDGGGGSSDEYVQKSGDTMTGGLTTPNLTVGSRYGNVGTRSTVEGYDNTASGANSHAEGYGCKATASNSHAEGAETTASGGYAHAEGAETTASGGYSHAEGSNTTASAEYSHAEGRNTVAGYENQHVQGKFNNNKSADAFEIGNGTSSARSNALEVTWDGDLTMAGEIEDGHGNVLSGKANASDLSAVATSGSYNDLSDKPTIPTGGVTGVKGNNESTYRTGNVNITLDNLGAGAAASKSTTDSTSASAIGTSTNLPTERDIYYGLPNINGSHTYNSNTNIYAPTSAGTSGQVLKSNGSGAPVWGNIEIPIQQTGGTSAAFTINANSSTYVKIQYSTTRYPTILSITSCYFEYTIGNTDNMLPVFVMYQNLTSTETGITAEFYLYNPTSTTYNNCTVRAFIKYIP